jgi:hypothetical protein
MSAEPLILAYAHPSTSADAPADATVFTFASPPVRAQSVFIALCFCICTAGAAVVIALGAGAALDERRRDNFIVIGSMVGLAVLIGIVWMVSRELGRIRRFGQADVRLEIKPPMLLVWAPQQWGGEPHTMEIEKITRISAHSAGNVVGVPIYQIHIRRVRWLTTYWSIRVAVANAGVIKRSIADLNHAIQRAKESPERRADSPTDPPQ